MGFMDLSTSVASKKHVDFNDARYQLSDRLRQSGKQQARSTFTLYDNKESTKVAVQDISAEYALSDKHLPIGELLNKMVDLIIDMEDGILDTEKDAVYAWKFSIALLNMYEDKSKRQESLSSFDNGLKNSVINSQVFIKRYPGKYINRTNFFDPKVKEEFIVDIVATFKDVALPTIHDVAIKQSREVAERHNNPILDKIVHWAMENYGCEVDSFFDIKEDEVTNLFYSTNTIILHLKNGYDMSIIGYVGTDHDDKFAISIFDANNISIAKHGDRISQDELQSALQEASANSPIDPLTKLLSDEKKKNAVLKEQYEILSAIRPMIPASALELKAAEYVVGRDYIWGCKQYRETHEDLPQDFKLSDVELPEFVPTGSDLANEKKKEFEEQIDSIADTMTTKHANSENVEENAKEIIQEANGDVKPSTPPTPPSANSSKDIENLFTVPDDLFTIEEPVKKVEEKKFGDPERTEFKMPTLTVEQSKQGAQNPGASKMEKDYDPTTTLLPGSNPIIKKKEENIPSVTAQAKPIPKNDTTEVKWKDEQPNTVLPPIGPQVSLEKKTEDVAQPELLLDDISSLFD
jgi:hypothetical protein